MVEFCQNAEIRLMANENYRWQVRYSKAKDLLKSGIFSDHPWHESIHKRHHLSGVYQYRSVHGHCAAPVSIRDRHAFPGHITLSLLKSNIAVELENELTPG
jgi:hypothetical protein